MKSKYLFFSMLFTLTAIVSVKSQTASLPDPPPSAWNGTLYDYTGYTRTHMQGGFSGTITNDRGTSANQMNNSNGYLTFDGTGGFGGNRAGRWSIGTAVSFTATEKLVIEFDYAANNITGTGAGAEGQFVFRSGTDNFTNQVLFTLFNVRGRDNELGIAVGNLVAAGGWERGALVNEAHRSYIPFIPGRWYHVKVEIYPLTGAYTERRICFTIMDGEGNDRQIMFQLPATYPTSINNVVFSAERVGTNSYWHGAVSNMGIRTLTGSQEATAVDIVAEEEEIGTTGSTSLTATVLPWDVWNHHITWEIDRTDLATITPGNPSWNATLTGLGGDFGDVTVTATSATGGVLGTKVITIADVKLANINISGTNSVSINHDIQLLATVAPLSASNTNVVWSSENENIATVDPSTGVVTGVTAGTATIVATAADGGGASDSYDVEVEFKPVEEIDLHGTRRHFYGSDPTGTPFILTPSFTPADASIKALQWSSTNASIATVNEDGQVSIVAGSAGTVAIKATATDGSDVERYYYIEVAPSNPWTAFNDFETNETPFPANGVNQSGDNHTSRSLFQQTNVIEYWTGSAPQSGTRWVRFPFANNNITGSEIRMRFDWWAGDIRGANNTSVLSIQDVASGTSTSIIAFVTCPDPQPFEAGGEIPARFRYHIGNYELSASSLAGAPIEGIERFDRWYTVDIVFNFQDAILSFTIHDRDEPSIAFTATDVPMHPVDLPEPRIAQFFVGGLRVNSDLVYRASIDNFGYQILNPDQPSSYVQYLSLDGLDKVVSGGQIMLYPRFLPENASDKRVTVLSSDDSKATITVDAQGRIIVTGVSDGVVELTVTSVENPDIFATKTITVGDLSLPQRQIERIDRGLVAVRTANSGTNVLLTWRLFGSDPENVSFNIYKNNSETPLNNEPLGPDRTNFMDTSGAQDASYRVAVLVGGEEIYRCKEVSASIFWSNQRLEIPVTRPVGRLNTTGATYTSYHINSSVVADLDGDGQYDIVFAWAPDNLRDNSHEGETGTVFIDAYKLDGTKLWGAGKFIDLGRNIRAGAHYLQLSVHDFDGDGKAEIAVRASNGTTDTEGRAIGAEEYGSDAAARNVYHGQSNGRVLAGPEYVAIFEGATGKLMDYKPYLPARGNVSSWGDTHGNRVDRFLTAVAYLDGESPSIIMTRGQYARTAIAAWDWDGNELTSRWVFDTRPGEVLDPDLIAYEGQGNHQLSVADVDGDGKDDIIFGAMTVSSYGTPMYSTGFNHGDAMHVGKFDPNRPGLQVMSVRESPRPWGMQMHDAMTGDLIWGVAANSDIGRGITASVDPLQTGTQSWGSGGMPTIGVDGTRLSGNSSGRSMNVAVYWDGDTGRELFDGGSNPTVTKVAGSGTPPNRTYAQQSIRTFTGSRTHGGSKNNAVLVADIFGDWREEIILASSNNEALHIYSTSTATVHTDAGAVPASGIPTLMHDPTYRMAIAWQHGGYNQPPHTGFYLGYNMTSGVPRSEGGVFTVTFNPNGGTFTDSNDPTENRVIRTMTGAFFDTPEVTRLNHIFDGWVFTDGTAFSPVASYKDDLVLVAKWVTNNYTLTFNANAEDVVVEPPTKGVTYGEAVGDLPTPTRAGYTFEGWNTEANGEGETYTDSKLYELLDNLTLFAQWTKKVVFTVTFNANEGVLSPPTTREVEEGEAIGDLPVPTRQGFSFVGWNTAQNASGTTFAANSTVTADITLYAQWTQLTNVSELGWNELNVYPNPANDIVFINGLQGGETITITDISGRRLMQIRAADTKEGIVVSNLPKGTYLVIITSDKDEKALRLVIE